MLLGEQLNTPNELFYVRHHLPVPHIKADDYRLTIEGAVLLVSRCRVEAGLAALCVAGSSCDMRPDRARWQWCRFQGLIMRI